MIHYTLRCSQGHRFDGWFASGAAFDRQSELKLLDCPVCGTADVSRAPMAPAIARGTTSSPAPNEAVQAQADAPGPAGPGPEAERSGPEPANVALLDERHVKLRAMLRAMRDAVVQHGVDVGRSFPDEARRIHYGESAPRGIYGQADQEEAAALLDEGIAILPMPPSVDDQN